MKIFDIRAVCGWWRVWWPGVCAALVIGLGLTLSDKHAACADDFNIQDHESRPDTVPVYTPEVFPAERMPFWNPWEDLSLEECRAKAEAIQEVFELDAKPECHVRWVKRGIS